MKHLGFASCPADPDTWMRLTTHSDGYKQYEYILLYVDDALAIGEHPEKFLCQGIGKFFQLKEKSFGSSKVYLGGSICKRILDNGVEAWGFSSSQYGQTAVKECDRISGKEKRPKMGHANQN
eukprot:10933973-Ditylum_brightwellii.AAC.1